MPEKNWDWSRFLHCLVFGIHCRCYSSGSYTVSILVFVTDVDHQIRTPSRFSHSLPMWVIYIMKPRISVMDWIMRKFVEKDFGKIPVKGLSFCHEIGIKLFSINRVSVSPS